MNKIAVIKALDTFKFHARIVWKGLYRMLYGALTAVLLGVSVYVLMMVSTKNGWVAVADFVLSVSALVLSGIFIYGMGKGGKNA